MISWLITIHQARIQAEIADADDEDYPEGAVVGVLGCSIDITDEKARSGLEVENARLAAGEQLAKEQSRMKSKFLANMSHEIRTPVAVSIARTYLDLSANMIQGVIGLANLLLVRSTWKDSSTSVANLSRTPPSMTIREIMQRQFR